MLCTPGSKFGIVIGPVNLGTGQVLPKTQDPSAATTEVEDGREISNPDLVPLQDIDYAPRG
jgi:hypothetical protein